MTRVMKSAVESKCLNKCKTSRLKYILDEIEKDECQNSSNKQEY